MYIQNLINKYINKYKRHKFNGVSLPPLSLRMGGAHFKDDKDFVSTAQEDVEKLVKLCGLKENDLVYDWGCGAGRLAVGLKLIFNDKIRYQGADIQANLINWAVRNLEDEEYKFELLDNSNERYNPAGDQERTFGINESSVDVFYAYSVFSHLNQEDAACYLKLLATILKATGSAFFTAFVEEGVADWVENPKGYGPLNWTGRLHCTRFEKSYFESLITAAGLKITFFSHATETDGQSAFVIARI